MTNKPTGILTAANTINIGKMCKVFLDGVEVKYAVSCDTDAGIVTSLAVDGTGDVIVDDGGYTREHHQKGVVTAEWV